jgi:hypothetical protein
MWMGMEYSGLGDHATRVERHLRHPRRLASRRKPRPPPPPFLSFPPRRVLRKQAHWRPSPPPSASPPGLELVRRSPSESCHRGDTDGRKEAGGSRWRLPRSCAGGRSRRRASMVSARFHLWPVCFLCVPVSWRFMSCSVCPARTCTVCVRRNAKSQARGMRH